MNLPLLLALSFPGPPLPAEQDPSPRTAVHTVESADGVEIAYEVGGSGSPTIVFVHGWSCDRSYWSAQVAEFAGAHRVVAIDLGGHGESGTGREQWTMEAFGADVAAVLDDLDVEDAVLVGHSMGASAIVEAARRVPDRVAALVPVDHFQEVGNPMSAADRERFLSTFRDDFRQSADRFVRQMFGPHADPELVDRIAKDMAAAPPEIALSALEHVVRYDEAEGLKSLEAPLRLLNADLWPTDLEALRRCRPDVQLAVTPGVGHFVMLEAPEEFARLLRRAVFELTGSPGEEE